MGNTDHCRGPEGFHAPVSAATLHHAFCRPCARNVFRSFHRRFTFRNSTHRRRNGRWTGLSCWWDHQRRHVAVAAVVYPDRHPACLPPHGLVWNTARQKNFPDRHSFDLSSLRTDFIAAYLNSRHGGIATKAQRVASPCLS